jgi:AAA+ ATPase superfamily predicted ATPase
MLVLAGSAFSFMQGLTGYGGALHGRRTAQLAIHPFDYFDAAFFYQQFASSERVRAYACYGGIPAYLQFIDPELSLAANLLRTTLAPGHMLFREAEELLRTEFHQEALYSSILRAIATGEERPSDIARAVGRHSANEVFDHLQRLIELRFVRREVPVTEAEQARNQRVLYRLADPYLRFWFRFVSPFQSLLQLGQGDVVWEREIQPALQEFVARTTWEEACTQHLRRRIAAKSLPASVAQLGRWWDKQDEIDLVGLWRGKVTLVGECKWTAAPVDDAVLRALQVKAQKLPLAALPLWVLASRSGFTPAVQRRAQLDNVLLLEPQDLYASGDQT